MTALTRLRGALPTAAGVFLFAVLCSAVLVAPPATATPTASGMALTSDDVCSDCHDFDDERARRIQHQPFASGDCVTCHNPHVARFAALLKEQPGPLCRECHPDIALESQKPVVHLPFAEQRCADCHEPHASSNKGLLVAPGIALCQECHSEVEQWTRRAVQHPPFADHSCSTCHDAHAATNESLLKASGANLCADCHGFDAGFRSAHAGYPVERARCQTCHDPHASEGRGLLRETVHAPFGDRDCELCHAGKSASDPFSLIATERELCGNCHDDAVDASLSASFTHVSGGGGRCTSCHNPHAGTGPAMLRSDQITTCLTCHNPGGSKSGGEGRFVTHANDTECSACHAPHGSEWPVLMKQDPIEVCGECHQHEHGVRHPVGEESLDPRSGNPMDCGSCHGVHHAGYKMYLHASDEGELCLSCHREIGGS